MSSLEDAIRDTQAVLQPLFSKPKLSTKLLTKPPFRFIHDIITATLRTTGFPDGYFTPDELISKNFADKASKVTFLDRFIHLVSVCHGASLNVRSGKIVSGLEPLETNVLLTCFGRAATDTSLDRAGVIAHCLHGGSVNEFIARTRETAPTAVADAPPTNTAVAGERRADESLEIAGQTSEPQNTMPPVDGFSIRENEETQNSGDEENNPEPDDTPLEERIRQCNTDPERTRQVMAQIVSKPKCTDKLLGKPPFRFLHDLIMAVNRAADLGLEQIYSEQEMVSSNVKDKESKLVFLEKIIKHVESKLDTTVEARPGKIVAGSEPEFTRRFLQLLALAATMGSVAKNGTSSNSEANIRDSKVQGTTDSTEKGDPKKTSPTEDNKSDDTPSEEKNNGDTNESAKNVDSEITQGGGTGEKEGHVDEIPSASRSIALLEERIRQCNTDPERTRQVLADIISKPRCTDKLLGKPPFRFLHDLIMGVNKATGMGLENIYSEDEMVSSNVKEKHAKLAFLDKIIKHVESKLDTAVEAQPGKIVSGLEPENTCRFLQLFAVAATMDSGADALAPTSNEVDNKVVAQKDPSPSNGTAHDVPPKAVSFSTATAEEAVDAPEKVANAKADRELLETRVETTRKDPANDLLPKNGGGTQVGSAKDIKESEAKKREKLIVMRPSTARRGPPRVKERPMTSQQEAPKVSTTVILMDDEEDVSEDIAIKDHAFDFHQKEANNIDRETSDAISAEGRTRIIQKIVGEGDNDKPMQVGESSPKSGGIRLRLNIGKKGGTVASSMASVDLQTLSDGIQRLVQSTAPLGRCMDHVQNDLKQMAKERDQLRSEYRQQVDALETSKRQRSSALLSLDKELSSLDEQVQGRLEKIKAVKQQMCKNNIYIQKRLSNLTCLE